MTDAWWTIDEVDAVEEPAAPATAAVRELVPDGDHEVQIVHQANEDERLALRLSTVEGRYSFVFLDFYRKNRDGSPNTRARSRMAALATALGMTADAWVEAVKAGDLVGRRFIATTRQWQQGERTRVEVDKFAAAPPAERETKPKAKRQTVAKKITAQTPEDDIPF